MIASRACAELRAHTAAICTWEVCLHFRLTVSHRFLTVGSCVLIPFFSAVLLLFPDRFCYYYRFWVNANGTETFL